MYSKIAIIFSIAALDQACGIRQDYYELAQTYSMTGMDLETFN